MQNLIKTGIVSVNGLLLSGLCSAGVIVDTITTFDGDGYVGWWDNLSYTHDLTTDVLGTPFEPGVDTAISGLLEVDIYDDSSRRRDDCIWRTCIPEVALFIVEGLDYDTGALILALDNFNGELEINALAAVNSSGMLNVEVMSLWGDFYIGESRLTIETLDSTDTGDSDVTVAVSEPGSIALLGIGALGLLAARRSSAK